MADLVHVRAAIRHAVAALLKERVAAVAGRVHVSRGRAVDEGDAPCLLVYIPKETVDVVANVIQRRGLDVVIEVVARELDAVDDALDAVALQVEAAAAEGVVVGGAAVALDLVETTIGLGQGSRPLGVARMVFAAYCFCDAGDPVARD